LSENFISGFHRWICSGAFLATHTLYGPPYFLGLCSHVEMTYSFFSEFQLFMVYYGLAGFFVLGFAFL